VEGVIGLGAKRHLLLALIALAAAAEEAAEVPGDNRAVISPRTMATTPRWFAPPIAGGPSRIHPSW